MKLGVLETGPVATQLVAEYGEYTQHFERLLRPHLPEASFVGYSVHSGALPDRCDAADGWIISGSKYGAYEDLPWIPPLEEFLRTALRSGIPVAGICFGHQILATALGGEVTKFDGGWGLGVHDYDVHLAPSWMDTAADSFRTIAIHQDQIARLPPNATRLAGSAFCEFAALAYGDPDTPAAISVQPHPEFVPDFAAGLIDIRRGNAFPEDRSAAARTTLSTPTNNSDWGRWIANYFRLAATAAPDQP